MVELVDTTDLKSVDPKGRAGSSPAPGTKREIAAMRSPVFLFLYCMIQDGDFCRVTSGTHKGKEGAVRDVNTSKGGNVTVTIVQAGGERFKTLARSCKKC